jgi:aminoglycoside 3-N-acetyltransferase
LARAVAKAGPAGHEPTRIADDLRGLGLPDGRDVLVHTSLTQIGPVRGGPGTVLAALVDIVGPSASVMVPTHTANNSTTSNVHRRATMGMTADQRSAFENAMAGFDPLSTASFGMGRLAEYVRRHPDAVRSAHPQTSFAALGGSARQLLAVHDLNCHLGPRSPMGALYEADASILLAGVGYEACTALHLAEYRLDHAPIQRYRCYVDEGGQRLKREFDAIYLDDSDFDELGAALDREPFVRHGRLGRGLARLLPLRQAVDFAEQWMRSHRHR